MDSEGQIYAAVPIEMPWIVILDMEGVLVPYLSSKSPMSDGLRCIMRWIISMSYSGTLEPTTLQALACAATPDNEHSYCALVVPGAVIVIQVGVRCAPLAENVKHEIVQGLRSLVAERHHRRDRAIRHQSEVLKKMHEAAEAERHRGARMEEQIVSVVGNAINYYTDVVRDIAQIVYDDLAFGGCTSTSARSLQIDVQIRLEQGDQAITAGIGPTVPLSHETRCSLDYANSHFGELKCRFDVREDEADPTQYIERLAYRLSRALSRATKEGTVK